MSRHIKYLVTILTLFACVFSLQANAATINASSTSLSDVKSAISSASSGDVVIVPAGRATWTSPLFITKGIILKGAGIDSTILTNGIAASQTGDYLIYYEPAVPATDGMVDISGFTFDGGNSGGAITVVNLSSTAIYNFRIHHNKFQHSNSNGSGEKQAAIYTRGNTFGLVDHNEFYNNFKDVVVLGNQSDSWATYPGLANVGTNKYLYIENNTSTTSADFVRDLFIGETGEGARWVGRYNTVDATTAHNIMDSHGDTLNRGVVAFEFYENTITSHGNPVVQSYEVIQQRGGLGMIYNNSAQYGTDGVRSYDKVAEEYASCTNPGGCPNSSGGACGAGDVVNNSYHFNNKNSRNNTLMFFDHHRGIGDADPYNCITEQTDYWSDTQDGSSTPTTYFTKGLASGRNLTTCTAQKVYWETDTKKLYRCTATNTWTKVYEPYTYPHPLSKPISKPTPPQNLRITSP